MQIRQKIVSKQMYALTWIETHGYSKPSFYTNGSNRMYLGNILNGCLLEGATISQQVMKVQTCERRIDYLKRVYL